MSQLQFGEKIEKMLLDSGYFPTEDLTWKATLFVNKFAMQSQSKGQAVSALCLDGPPGSGKTEFVIKYKEVAEKCLEEKINFIQYQCNTTTGREDLFEEINIKAVVQNDAENVILRGKLIDAIEKLNNGEKVILFLDEFDKAKEETDDFLLSFLQSGQVFSTQLGTAEVKREYLGNLQVFVVKNDKRERLTGPLESRLDYVHLSEMSPEIMHKVLMRAYGNQDERLVKLCSILYELQYVNKEKLEKVTSCRECLVSIRNCLDLMKVNAPQRIIYNTLLDGLCKIKDDREVFLSFMRKSNDKSINALCNLFKKDSAENEKTLAKIWLYEKEEELSKKSETLEKKSNELDAKIAEAENLIKVLTEKNSNEKQL